MSVSLRTSLFSGNTSAANHVVPNLRRPRQLCPKVPTTAGLVRGLHPSKLSLTMQTQQTLIQVSWLATTPPHRVAEQPVEIHRFAFVGKFSSATDLLVALVVLVLQSLSALSCTLTTCNPGVRVVKLFWVICRLCVQTATLVNQTNKMANNWINLLKCAFLGTLLFKKIEI